MPTKDGRKYATDFIREARNLLVREKGLNGDESPISVKEILHEMSHNQEAVALRPELLKIDFTQALHHQKDAKKLSSLVTEMMKRDRKASSAKVGRPKGSKNKPWSKKKKRDAAEKAVKDNQKSKRKYISGSTDLGEFAESVVSSAKNNPAELVNMYSEFIEVIKDLLTDKRMAEIRMLGLIASKL